MATKTLTPKEIALEFSTTGKTLRKFLRSTDSGISDLAPGKGGRWAIPATRVKTLQKRFDAWKVAQAEEAAKRRDALASAESDADEEIADDDATGEEVLDEDEVLTED